MALWTPSQLPTSLWLDAADAGSITIDTGVSQWADKSGNARHVTQSTTDARPAYITSPKPAIRFDGLNDYLLRATGINSLPVSIFIAATRGTTHGAMISVGSWEYGVALGYGGINSLESDGTYLAVLKNYIAWVANSATFAVGSVVAAIIPSGSTATTLWQNGSSVAITAGATAATRSPNGPVYIGWGNYAGRFYNGDIHEIIILTAIATDEERQKIEGYLAHKWGFAGNLPADHPYKDAAPTTTPPPNTSISTTLEQPYGDTPIIGAYLDQLYSIVLEIWLTQFYGGVPVIGKHLIQPYAGAAVLNKSLQQRWGDALQIDAHLLQDWSMPDALDTFSDQQYGITAEVLNLTCEQIYHINEHSTLLAGLVQPYAIAAEASRLYKFDTKLYVNGERIPFHSLNWEASVGSYAWQCDFAVKILEIARKCIDGAEITITSCGDTWHLKCYDGWFLDKRHGAELYRVYGCSKTKDLDIARPLLGDLPGGMASELVADLAAPFGITVDWQMADGYLQDGTITANDETPLAVIKNIVHAAKGIVMSTYDGNLLIVAEEETPIPEYPTVEPADTIIARLERISTSEQKDEQRGYNRFIVSDQLASGDGFSWDEVQIDGRTKEVRLFVVPLDLGRKFTLIHSGGSDVSIEPFGLVARSIPGEVVEFVSGFGKTSKPIYARTASSWMRADLGDVEFAEGGLLSAETAGESLLRITYETRYYRWIVRDRDIETVQVIFHEVLPQ